MKDWPFDQPQNCATFTRRQILEGSEPILRVTHDKDDHGWQFIGSSNALVADCKIVSLQEIVQLDPTILELADLEPGWQAFRDFVGAPWIRRPHPSVQEGEK